MTPPHGRIRQAVGVVEIRRKHASALDVCQVQVEHCPPRPIARKRTLADDEDAEAAWTFPSLVPRQPIDQRAPATIVDGEVLRGRGITGRGMRHEHAAGA